MENAPNFSPFAVDTVANYDPAICPYLEVSVQTAYIRDGDGFRRDDSFFQPDRPHLLRK